MTTSEPEPATNAQWHGPDAHAGEAGGPQETLFVGPVGSPDEYELVGTGHKGGEGLVFRARYKGSLPRAVTFAVKQLIAPPGVGPEEWPDEDLVERWREQLKLLHLVRHLHLVGYREIASGWPPHPEGTCSGEPPAELRSWYLVMEWVEGPSFHELVRSGRSPVADTVKYVAQLAEAVEYLHSGTDTAGMALLHRDIKPGNVIINRERGAVLVDYGLMRVEEPTLTALPVWTGPYLAPEVHADKTRTSRASDVWAVAATAFFALTGEQPSPFDPGLMRRSLADHSVDGVVDPESLVAVVMGVLEHSPDERPNSPVEWAAGLVGAVDGTVRAVPPGPDESSQGHQRAKVRRRALATRLAAAAVIVAAVVAGLLLSGVTPLTHPATATKATQQVLFEPFNTNVTFYTVEGPAPHVKVTFQTTGQCSASQADTSRSDAYFCAVAQSGGTGYHDPCFLGPYESAYLLCFISPTNLGATKVTPTNHLTTNRPKPNGDPWALRLADGQLCVTLGEGGGPVDGLRDNYGCPNGQLYGNPDRAGAAWTIFYQATGSTSLVNVGIVTSYR